MWNRYISLYTVLFSHSVVSDSLWPRGLQHTRLPCPSPTPRACSNSSPLSPWCHSTISSSVVPFSSCLQSFPASGSFQMNQFFTSGGQSIGVSASASVLPVNIQDWFPCSPRDSQESSPTPQFKSALYSSPWYLETRVGLSRSLTEIKLSSEVIHTTGDTSTIYVLNFSNRLTHQANLNQGSLESLLFNFLPLNPQFPVQRFPEITLMLRFLSVDWFNLVLPCMELEEGLGTSE